LTARRLALGAAVVAFLAVSLLVARWLSADGVERSAITELLEAQAAGDGDAVVRRLACRDAACRAEARENARRLRTRGEVEIVRLDSATARSLGAASGAARVVWQAPGRLPTVQCVQVRREGDPLSGTAVALVRLSRPIGRESPCPDLS
jgi:hypothetical protein